MIAYSKLVVDDRRAAANDIDELAFVTAHNAPVSHCDDRECSSFSINIEEEKEVIESFS